jgi:transcription initiation factor IIE alpha subunit
MPKCPKCGAEIQYLVCYYVVEELKSTPFYGDRYGFANEEDSYIRDIGYFCPECDQMVAETEEEAQKILETPPPFSVHRA